MKHRAAVMAVLEQGKMSVGNTIELHVKIRPVLLSRDYESSINYKGLEIHET